MAVGTWERSSTQPPGYTDQPFSEQWNGTSWTVADMPAPAGASNVRLTGISCASAVACTAVGYRFVPSEEACLQEGQCVTTPASYAAFAERWNGQGWTVQTVPNPSSQTQLLGVSCTSASSCSAVGRYYGVAGGPGATGDGSGTPYVRTLAERWNGRGWSVLGRSAPLDGWFAGVSCLSDTACFAAGDDAGHPLAEKWSGTVWTPQVTPDPNPISTSGGPPDFSSVWCTSVTVCTAIGNRYTLTNGVSAHFVGTAFAEQLNDGSLWHVQAIANPAAASDTQLHSVACQSAWQCTAVGGYFTAPDDSEYTVAAHWNGVGWTTQQPPNPAGSATSSLTGVSCASATVCTAVGYSATGANGTATPLVEQSS